MILLMAVWHMFCDSGVSSAGRDAQMGGHPLVVEKDRDGRLGGTHVDLPVDEGIGNTVVVLLELDVVAVSGPMLTRAFFQMANS